MRSLKLFAGNRYLSRPQDCPVINTMNLAILAQAGFRRPEEHRASQPNHHQRRENRLALTLTLPRWKKISERGELTRTHCKMILFRVKSHEDQWQLPTLLYFLENMNGFLRTERANRVHIESEILARY